MAQTGAQSLRARRPEFAKRLQLSEEIKSYIRELITSGQVRAGEFLRLEQIALDLGVSVTPVREALMSLDGEGFVKLAPRRGFVVASLTQKDIEDLYVMQAFLAGELASRAAAAMTDEQLKELEQVQRNLEEASKRKDVESVEQLNFTFHSTINHAAGDSDKLIWLLRMVTRYAPRRFYGNVRGWRAASPKSHRAVLAAFRARDPERAREAMSSHIKHAGETLIEHLRTVGFFDEGAGS